MLDFRCPGVSPWCPVPNTPVKAVSAHKVAWTDDEVRRILSCIQHPRKDVQQECLLFFTIMATTGCRDSELRALRWEDFGPDRVTFRAASTKSRKERTVPVNRTVQELASGLREATGEVFPLVPVSNQGRNKILRRAMAECRRFRRPCILRT